MNTAFHTSVRFHPGQNQLSISREGSAISHRLEGHGGPVQVHVADSIDDPLLRGLNGRTTELSKLQEELQGVVAPHAEKARSVSRWSQILGGVGLAAAGICALTGLGGAAIAGAVVLGIGSLAVGQAAARKVLQPVQNCIDLGWSLKTMQSIPPQPGAFFDQSQTHASNPYFLRR